MSKAIYNPALSSIEEHSDTSATFIVEPLHAGYGNTLGNSLRRVLLSSVQGAAIVAFRIEGATHEFTTVSGIKEDVVDIMLNLKNVRLKVHTDQPVELRLEKSGAGTITAADIKTTADVEVINPDQLIATIDDPKKSVVIDLVVESGRGYRTIEESSAERIHSDMIALDAVFTPVLRVRYKVDSTRVGQETNLDKLALTVETDGSITAREAFEEAALRELEEETGVSRDLVRIEAENEGWLAYDLPLELLDKLWGGKYRGQEQKWFRMRFLGSDEQVNIETDHPEFAEWKWIDQSEMVDAIVPFKRDVYIAVLDQIGNVKP